MPSLKIITKEYQCPKTEKTLYWEHFKEGEDGKMVSLGVHFPHKVTIQSL